MIILLYLVTRSMKIECLENNQSIRIIEDGLSNGTSPYCIISLCTKGVLINRISYTVKKNLELKNRDSIVIMLP